MAGICRNLRMTPFDINGMEDHAHLVVRLPPVIALAEAVKVIKSNSSRWMGSMEDDSAGRAGTAPLA
jgi:REP-associated tyrosine transposase